ncbi:unnamed protein product [Calicophoron daubneyi]|uniref:GDNF/GAS1 domain-containing protein n=1 Tax=Calicophoron daubneyi TaxID=300641 RepID=A0AAV2T2U7_CALDB
MWLVEWMIQFSSLMTVGASLQAQTPPTDWDIRANIPVLSNPANSDPVSQRDKGARLVKQEYTNRDSASALTTKDCLDTIRACETESGICKVDLEIFRQFCGDWMDERSLLGCRKDFVKECRSALMTVNHGRPGLRHCTCDGQASRSIDDLSRCNLLRRNLNHHPCLHEPPIFFRDPPKAVIQRPPVPAPTTTTIKNTDLIQQHNTPSAVKQVDLSMNRRNVIPPSLVHPVMETNKSETSSNSGPTQITNSWPISKTNVSSPASSSVGESETRRPSTGPLPAVQKAQDLLPNRSGSISCLELLESCTRQSACARSLNRFRALCTDRSCEKLRPQCIRAYKEFQMYGADGKCTCDKEETPSRKQRCMEYEASVLDNKCVEMVDSTEGSDNSRILFATEFRPAQQSPDSEQHAKDSTNKEITGVPILTFDIRNRTGQHEDRTESTDPYRTLLTPPNCFDAYHECIRNPACLWFYLRLAQFCAWSGMSTNCYLSSTCRKLLKNFYSKTESYVYAALSCTCSDEDIECHEQRNIFRPECRSDGEALERCDTIWEECRMDLYCRNSYADLTSDCTAAGKKCQFDPYGCIESYRRFWSRHFSSTCQCGQRQSVQNFAMTTASDSGVVTCQEFRQLLASPPCQSGPPIRSVGDTDYSSDNKARACKLASRLKVPAETILRIYSNGRSLDEINRRVSGCSQLCSCRNGCLKQLCFPERLRASTREKEQDFSVETRMPAGISDPSLTRKSTCAYLPIANPGCNCHVNDEIVCNSTYILPGHSVLDHRLTVTYDVYEYVAILELLDGSRVSNELQFYSSLMNFGGLLVSLIRSATGDEKCGLALNGHRFVARADDSSEAVSSPSSMKTKSVAHNGHKYGQLSYSVTASSNSFAGSAYLDRTSATDCLQSFQLLKVMVDRRLPRIRYHSILSTVKMVVLSSQPAPENITQATPNTYRSKSGISDDQQHSWRKPRTSYKKQTASAQGKSENSAIRTGQSIFVTLTTFTLFVIAQ